MDKLDSTKENNRIKIIENKLNEATELLYRNRLSESKTIIDSIQRMIDEWLIPEELQIEVLLVSVFYLISTNQLASAKQGLNEIKVFPAVSNPKLDYHYKLYLGISYTLEKQHSDAINTFQDLLYADINDISETDHALLYYYISYSYREVNDLQNSFLYLERAISLFSKLGNMHYLSRSYLNMGNIYFYRSNWKSAIDQYNKVLRFKKDIDDDKLLAQILHNIGLIYYQTEEKENAYSFWERSLNIIQNINENEMVIPLFNMYYAYYLEKKWGSFLKIAFELEGRLKYINFPVLEARTYRTLGHYYREVENNPIYLSYYNKALDIFMKHNHLEAGDLCYTIAVCTNTFDLYKESTMQYRKYIQQLKINYEHGMVSSL